MFFTDLRLETIFKNKTVAIVGPAPTLIEKGFGEYIDSFDVVLHPNRHFVLPDYRKLDYGSKYNVLASNFNCWSINQISENLVNSSFDYIFNIQAVYESTEDVNRCCGLFGKEIIRIPNEAFFRFYQHAGSTTISGINLVQIVLDNGAKEVFVAGFNFYNSGDFSGWTKIYYSEYFEQEIKHNKSFHQVPTQSGHNFLKCKEFFRTEYLEKHKDRIVVDDTIERLYLN